MLKETTPIVSFKNKVFEAALKISTNEVPKMSVADNTYFPIVLIRSIYLKMNSSNRLKNSFPRGFLLNGIIDNAIAHNDTQAISKLEKSLDSFVNELNQTSSAIKYTDQITMGMVLIKLYKYTNNEKYKKACDVIIKYVVENINQEYNILLYRKNKKFHYVDILGMACPFILLYAQTFDRKDLIALSNAQIEFYLKNGMASSHLPFHGIELANNMPIGSSNWGRGLGWYILALSATLAYTNAENNPKYDFFFKEFNKLAKTLSNCKHNHYWGQFIGISKQWHVDTSVSCMVFYSLSLVDQTYDHTTFYRFIKPLTLKNGFIDYTSGDTEDINIYSREYGKSELTQGLLLSIFNTEKINK